MSTGKTAAQVAHASCLSLHWHELAPLDPQQRYANAEELFDKWWNDGHYAKYIMQADDSDQLHNIEQYLNERDFKTFKVIDEGHTEDTRFRATALAVELVDKDDERVRSIFGEFRTYKDPKPSKITFREYLRSR